MDAFVYYLPAYHMSNKFLVLEKFTQDDDFVTQCITKYPTAQMLCMIVTK